MVEHLHMTPFLAGIVLRSNHPPPLTAKVSLLPIYLCIYLQEQPVSVVEHHHINPTGGVVGGDIVPKSNQTAAPNRQIRQVSKDWLPVNSTASLIQLFWRIFITYLYLPKPQIVLFTICPSLDYAKSFDYTVFQE